MMKTDCYYCGKQNVYTMAVYDYEGVVRICQSCVE